MIRGLMSASFMIVRPCSATRGAPDTWCLVGGRRNNAFPTEYSQTHGDSRQACGMVNRATLCSQRLPAGRSRAMLPKSVHDSPIRSIVGALALTVSSHTNAQQFASATLEQVSSNGANCATPADLSTAVEQRLQRPVFVSGAPADLKVRVSYTFQQQHWTANVELLSARDQHLGLRRIASQNEDCASIVESLALVIALMVDITRADVEARTVAAPSTEPTVVQVPSPDKPPSTPSISHTRSPRLPSWSSLVVVGGAMNLGQFPNVGLGARVGTELWHHSTWAVKAGISAFFPNTLEDGAYGRARYSLQSADLATCLGALDHRLFDLALCAGASLGLKRAAGAGYRVDRVQQTPVVAPMVRVDSSWWPTARVGLRVSFGLGIPLLKGRTYATRADGSTAFLHEPAWIVPELHAGICLAL